MRRLSSGTVLEYTVGARSIRAVSNEVQAETLRYLSSEWLGLAFIVVLGINNGVNGPWGG